MKSTMNKQTAPSLTAVLEKHCMNGDAYVTEEQLFDLYRAACGGLSYQAFKRELLESFSCGSVHREGRRIYLDKTFRYEQSAAQSLSRLMKRQPLPETILPEPLVVGGYMLSAEQCEAVQMALDHRLSIIIGGAGSGKSTIIEAIAEQGTETGTVLCAPTGKAARNITERIGRRARTVHSACGLYPDEDFFPPVQWTNTDIVIVDEAGMLTLEMLAYLLCLAPDDCRIVLLGDPNQLQSVGTGNVLPDLVRLGIPCTELSKNFRQLGCSALRKNVVGFGKLYEWERLAQDQSFEIIQVADCDLAKRVVEIAVRHYSAGESFQVLTPFNTRGDLSVKALNPRIRDLLNPPRESSPDLNCGSGVFREGDRVMLRWNDRERDCCNGDIGRLHIIGVSEENGTCSYSIVLPDGRCPRWDDVEIKQLPAMLDLAYVISIHKSQGSQYGTVLMPVSMRMKTMLSRNLFYTAISRAENRMILCGDTGAIDTALKTPLPQRKSVLVSKVQMQLLAAA